MPDRTAAAIYARCSTGRQAQRDLSIPAQVEACERYCQQLGLEVRAVYRDAGLTGLSADRAALNAMLAAIRAREVTHVVVWDLSRFSREPEHGLAWWNEIMGAGAELLSITQPMSGDRADRALFTALHFALGKHALEKQAKASRRGRRYAMRHRGHWPGRAPYGYSVVEKRLVVREDEAAWIREMVRWRIEEGLGCEAIARRLNAHGVPPPYAAHGVKRGERVSRAARPRGLLWAGPGIHQLLTRATLVGDAELRCAAIGEDEDDGDAGAAVTPEDIERACRTGERLEVRDTDRPGLIRILNSHPPIITREQQAALGWRPRRSQRDDQEPARPSTRRAYARPLAGLIRCPGCGLAMAGHADHARPGSTHRYRCRSCRIRTVREDWALADILRQIRGLLSDPERMATALTAQTTNPSALAEFESQLAALRARRSVLVGEIANLTAAVAEGGGQTRALVAAIAEREAEEAAALSAERTLRARVDGMGAPPLAEVTAWCADLLLSLDDAHDNRTLRLALGRVIDHVLWLPESSSL